MFIFALVCFAGEVAGQSVTARYNSDGTVTIENKSPNTIVIFKGNYSEANTVEEIIIRIVDRNSEVNPDLTYFAGWCGFTDNIAIKPENSATSTKTECKSDVINYYIIRDFSNQIPGAKKCLMSGTSVRIEKGSGEAPKTESTPALQTQQPVAEAQKDTPQTPAKTDEKTEQPANKQDDKKKEVQKEETKKTETTPPKDEKPHEDYQIKYKIPITILENSCKEFLSKKETLSEIEKAELKKELSKCDYFIRRIDEDRMLYEVYEKPHEELTEYIGKLKLLEMNILARLSSISTANIDDIEQKYNTEVLSQIRKNVQSLEKIEEEIEATKQLHSLAQWKAKRELQAEISAIDSSFQINLAKSDTFIEREKKRFSASEDIEFIEKLDNQIPDLDTTIGKYQYMVKKLKTPYFFFAIIGFLAIVVLYVILSAIITSIAKRKRKRKSSGSTYQPSKRAKHKDEPVMEFTQPEPEEKPVVIVEIEENEFLQESVSEKKPESQLKSGELEIMELLHETEEVFQEGIEPAPQIEPATSPVEEEPEPQETESPEIIQETETEITSAPVAAVIIENELDEKAAPPPVEKIQPMPVLLVNGYFDIKNKVENAKIETIHLGTQVILDMAKALKNDKIGMQGFMYGEIPYISRHGQKKIIIDRFLPLERVYEQTSPSIGCLISEKTFSFKSALEKYISTINRFDFFIIYSLDDDILHLCTRSIYDSFSNDESLIPHLSLKDMKDNIA